MNSQNFIDEHKLKISTLFERQLQFMPTLISNANDAKEYTLKLITPSGVTIDQIITNGTATNLIDFKTGIDGKADQIRELFTDIVSSYIQSVQESNLPPVPLGYLGDFLYGAIPSRITMFRENKRNLLSYITNTSILERYRLEEIVRDKLTENFILDEDDAVITVYTSDAINPAETIVFDTDTIMSDVVDAACRDIYSEVFTDFDQFLTNLHEIDSGKFVFADILLVLVWIIAFLLVFFVFVYPVFRVLHRGTVGIYRKIFKVSTPENQRIDDGHGSRAVLIPGYGFFRKGISYKPVLGVVFFFVLVLLIASTTVRLAGVHGFNVYLNIAIGVQLVCIAVLYYFQVLTFKKVG